MTLRWLVVCAMLLIGTSGWAQMSSVSPRLLFQPLKASQYEPRMGVEKSLVENELTLNIGNSSDLLSFRGAVGGDSSELRIGGDFFTWSHLISHNNLRFPVQAVDYLFGVNASWRSSTAPNAWESRLRISHISAHMVDGSYDATGTGWQPGMPFTYSREFVDLLVGHSVPLGGFQLRYLLGGTLLFHSIPDKFGLLYPHVGFELHGDPTAFLVPFIAYDLRLQKIAAWRASHSLNLGAKFGGWNATGTVFYLAFEAGESNHGELYFQDVKHLIVGANIDF